MKAAIPASRAGMTLVEVLVAVTVLAFGTALLVRSFLSSASASTSADILIGAYQLMENRLMDKEIEALDGRPLEFSEYAEDVSIGGRAARLFTRLDRSDLDEQGRLVEIALKIEWLEGGRSRQATLTTRMIQS